eukprot:3074825-Pleurochrysis_carterae.AAC.1
MDNCHSWSTSSCTAAVSRSSPIMLTTRARVSARRCSRATTSTVAGSTPSPGSVPVYFPLENIVAHAAPPKSACAVSRSVPVRVRGEPARLR